MGLPNPNCSELPIDVVVERSSERLRELQAILFAIEAGELLAHAPGQAWARELHQRGVSLLTLLDRELAVVIEELETVSSREAG